MIALRADLVFDGSRLLPNEVVVIDGDRVVRVGAGVRDGTPIEDLSPGAILVPGFVDLQVNGAGGVLFNAEPTVAGLARIGDALARCGTTSFLPTLISARPLFDAAERAVSAALADPLSGVVGVHLEGPFINPARHGTHPLDAIQTMTATDATRLAPNAGWPRMVTLAPEMVDQALLTQIVTGAACVFAGHTDATAQQAADGFATGIVGATHLFNAMSQLNSRAPGVVGATLDAVGAVASIIVDGIHVDPLCVRIAHAALGPERLFLVSDSMPTAASETTSFTFKGETIELVDGRLLDANGSLAGAHLTMAEAVRNAVHLCGLPLLDALAMATATPAEVIGLTDRGRIAVGCRADLVALDGNLRVHAVWRAGVRLV